MVPFLGASVRMGGETVVWGPVLGGQGEEVWGER